MRRRRFRKPAVNVALFPFLAVLVCTMGSLIVLLVLMVQQARVEATSVVESVADLVNPDEVAELEMQLDSATWRREILDVQREEMIDALSDHRLQLSHLEDHIRRLEARWKGLAAEVSELESIQGEASGDVESIRERRDLLRDELSSATRELERLRSEVARRPRSFAIIPYAGPNGTQRRPIYIECREDGIVLQPEGIVLTAQDFDGPMGPGNPLDAALRTIREHLVELELTGTEGEPYPLLVVRPNGALAYNVARHAMKNWDDEFGYELIDADMKLAYPPTDPRLKQRIEQSIRHARQRQAALAAAMPTQFRGNGPIGFVASRQRGGLVPLSGETGQGVGGGSNSFGNASFATDRGGSSDGVEGNGSNSQSQDGESYDGEVYDGDSEATSGTGGPNASAGRPGGAGFSLSETRGKDWALPENAASATAVTRPVRVVCMNDRLIIVPERGTQSGPSVIMMPNGPATMIDSFVDQVWKHTEQWGIAMLGGYWKPLLQFEVARDADATYATIEKLMDGSGVSVERIGQ